MDISEYDARRQTLTAASGDIAYTESGAGPARSSKTLHLAWKTARSLRAATSSASVR